MTTDPVADLEHAVLDAAAELGGNGRRPDNARLSRPPKPDFGDYSSNSPMLLAPLIGEPPRAMAERLGELITKRLGDDLPRAEVAGPRLLKLLLSQALVRPTPAQMAAPG